MLCMVAEYTRCITLLIGYIFSFSTRLLQNIDTFNEYYFSKNISILILNFSNTEKNEDF